MSLQCPLCNSPTIASLRNAVKIGAAIGTIGTIGTVGGAARGASSAFDRRPVRRCYRCYCRTAKYHPRHDLRSSPRRPCWRCGRVRAWRSAWRKTGSSRPGEQSRPHLRSSLQFACLTYNPPFSGQCCALRSAYAALCSKGFSA